MNYTDEMVCGCMMSASRVFLCIMSLIRNNIIGSQALDIVEKLHNTWLYFVCCRIKATNVGVSRQPHHLIQKRQRTRFSPWSITPINPSLSVATHARQHALRLLAN